jgi:hypothetical protein
MSALFPRRILIPCPTDEEYAAAILKEKADRERMDAGDSAALDHWLFSSREVSRIHRARLDAQIRNNGGGE